MKDIIQYIKQYFRDTDKRILALVSAFTALVIFINYHFHLDDEIKENIAVIKIFYFCF